MRRDRREQNRADLRVVHSALSPYFEPIFFGGKVLALYAMSGEGADLRATQDVDVITAIPLGEQMRVEQRLVVEGRMQPNRDASGGRRGAFVLADSGTWIDIVPSTADNPYLEPACARARLFDAGDAVRLRAVCQADFLLLKLHAFGADDRADHLDIVSADLEDIVTLAAECPDLENLVDGDAVRDVVSALAHDTFGRAGIRDPSEIVAYHRVEASDHARIVACLRALCFPA